MKHLSLNVNVFLTSQRKCSLQPAPFPSFFMSWSPYKIFQNSKYSNLNYYFYLIAVNNGRQNGQSGQRGGNSRQPAAVKPSLEELDAELDAYVKNMKL